MKRMLMYIIAGIAVLFVGAQLYTTVATKGTEQQPYTVVRTVGAMEVRRYPEALTASVVRAGGTYKEVSGPASGAWPVTSSVGTPRSGRSP